MVELGEVDDVTFYGPMGGRDVSRVKSSCHLGAPTQKYLEDIIPVYWRRLWMIIIQREFGSMSKFMKTMLEGLDLDSMLIEVFF